MGGEKGWWLKTGRLVAGGRTGWRMRLKGGQAGILREDRLVTMVHNLGGWREDRLLTSGRRGLARLGTGWWPASGRRKVRLVTGSSEMER